MNDDLWAERLPKKSRRRGKGRGKPWRGPSEAEKRAAALLAHPPLKPPKPVWR